MGPAPYRLCCNCMETSSHPRNHLTITYRFKRAGDEMHSVSPDRRIYVATKRAKERRFLCSRKQLSGTMVESAEDGIEQQFLRLAGKWRSRKLPVAHERDNRTLLQECAAQLARSMEAFFSEEINPQLFLLTQKLGKTQKLKYSRMSNNCQDFCNGLLNYGSYYYPMFSTMYPFITASLSPNIDHDPDDKSLSYLQSFVKSLQYLIPGSNKRAMLGSAVTMYSSYAQNDADLIDHVYSVRFGFDSDNSFSLGFRSGPRAEENGHSCSLADHLLDCPVDNLSILQTHLHRQKKYYTIRDKLNYTNMQFLVNLPPSAWITNRLQILRRLKLLHDLLADNAAHFQELCRMRLPSFGVTDVKILRKVWRPVGTLFSRAWHMDKRDGSTLYYAPDIDFGTGEMNNYRAVGFLTLGTTFRQTHRQLIGGDELFLTRLKTMKSMLMARVAGKEEAWTPWTPCTCQFCKIHILKYRCHRVDCNAIDNDDCLERGESPTIYWATVVKAERNILKEEEERREERGTERGTE
ncbi:hypothetical protein BDV12DRAFT_209013 [Aspergillus spectabilis]